MRDHKNKVKVGLFCVHDSHTSSHRHADVMKKIIETVADGGRELGVHMYPCCPAVQKSQRSPPTFCEVWSDGQTLGAGGACGFSCLVGTPFPLASDDLTLRGVVYCSKRLRFSGAHLRLQVHYDVTKHCGLCKCTEVIARWSLLQSSSFLETRHGEKFRLFD